MPGEKFSRSEEAPQVLDQGARSPDSMNLRRSSGVIEKGKKLQKSIQISFFLSFVWIFLGIVRAKSIQKGGFRIFVWTEFWNSRQNKEKVHTNPPFLAICMDF